MHGLITARLRTVAVVLLAATGVCAATAGSASASNSASAAGSSSATPKRTSYIFISYYEDSWVGPVRCRGQHQTETFAGRHEYPGNEFSGGRDTEVCVGIGGSQLKFVEPGEEGGYTSSEADEVESFETRYGKICENPHYTGWFSDDGAIFGERATKYRYKVSSTGKSYSIEAVYPIRE
jgi:hypothetical protein